jgi:hypothetical protein
VARKKNVADAAKAKAEKQKKIAIGLIVVLALAGAYAVHTVMGLNSGGASASKPQVASTTDTTGSAPVAAPATPSALPAAPSLSAPLPTDTTATNNPAGSSQLIDAVQASAGKGQLQSFSLFESKDPFNAGGPTASTGGSSSGGSSSGGSSSGGGSTTSKPPTTPPAPPLPPAAAPTSAVISVNGTSESVSTGSNFPAASPVFQLVALTATTARVAVAGGSYASGSSTITLKVNTPVTLVNTADGTRYTLTLLPQGTAASAPPAAGAAGASTTTPTTTTPVVGG